MLYLFHLTPRISVQKLSRLASNPMITLATKAGVITGVVSQSSVVSILENDGVVSIIYGKRDLPSFIEDALLREYNVHAVLMEPNPPIDDDEFQHSLKLQVLQRQQAATERYWDAMEVSSDDRYFLGHQVDSEICGVLEKLSELNNHRFVF